MCYIKATVLPLSTMPFKFFRPWEDGGQDNTGQTPNPRHGAPSKQSETTTPPRDVPLQLQQLGVSSGEFKQTLQQEETYRVEKEEVSNVSNEDGLSPEVRVLTKYAHLNFEFNPSMLRFGFCL